MKMKQTSAKKTFSADRRETELQNLQDLFRAIENVRQKKFTGRLFLLICFKVDSYNCIPIAFFSL